MLFRAFCPIIYVRAYDPEREHTDKNRQYGEGRCPDRKGGSAEYNADYKQRGIGNEINDRIGYSWIRILLQKII